MTNIYESRCNEFKQYFPLSFLKALPEEFRDQFVKAFRFALNAGILSKECELVLNDEVCPDCGKNHIQSIAKTSLGAEYTDDFTRYMYSFVTVGGFSEQQLIYYDHEQRSVDILRELYEDKKINLISYGDYPGSDEDVYGDGVHPGKYFQKPGMKISLELVRLFLENIDYLNYLDTSREKHNNDILQLALSVTWNPDYFMEVISCHPDFPREISNDFYYRIIDALHNDPFASPKSVYNFITSVPLWYVNFYVKSRSGSGHEETALRVWNYMISKCNFMYDLLRVYIRLREKFPSRFNACEFLDLCAFLPGEIQNIIIMKTLENAFGKVVFRNGSLVLWNPKKTTGISDKDPVTFINFFDLINV